MQTSGTFPQLSDGTRKTVARPVAAARPAKVERPIALKASTHRSGGHAKQKGR